MTKYKLRLIGVAIMSMLAVLAPVASQAASNTAPKKTAVTKKTGKSNAKKSVNTVESPDFAFPQTVIDNAEVAMRKATASGNEAEIIRSVIQIVMANNLISTDRMPAMANMLDSLAQTSKTPGGAAILYSLEAQLYRQVYQSSRYQFDQRTLPLDSYPADPQQWSGQLFALKVLELVNKSLADSATLRAIPSSDWKPLLTSADEHSLYFYPTLYSILANRSLNFLDTFADGESVIPFGSEEQIADPSQRCISRRNAIASEWYNAAVASGNVAEISKAMYATINEGSETSKYKASIDAYEKYKSSPYSTEFLIVAENSLPANGNYNENRRKLITLLEECVAAHPDYFRVNAAKNALNDLTAGSGSLSVDNVISSQSPVKVQAKAYHMPKDTYACLFRLPANMKDRSRRQLLQNPNLKFITSRPIQSEEYKADTCTLDFGKLPVGRYILVTGKDPKGTRNSLYDDYAEFTVTDIALSVVKDNDKKYVLVTNTIEGKPYRDTKVRFSQERTGRNATATTDADGLAAFPDNWTQSSIDCTVSIGDDTQTLNEWISKGQAKRAPSVRAQVLTDLSLFHPGDTCSFTSIVYTQDNETGKRTLRPDARLRAVLYNTSYTPCDTLELTTDRNGRATGRFKLPADGMNGICQIRILNPDNNDGYEEFGSTSVRVEQYKQPSFFVELDKVQDIVPGDTLTVSGRVMTYSGMPVAGAAVKLNFNIAHMWWYDDVSGKYSANATTDAEGRFSLGISTNRLADTDYKNQYYSVIAAVTSEAGESQESETRSFYIGSELKINYTGRSQINGDAEKLTFPFAVIGGKGDKQPLEYSFTDLKDVVVLSGQSDSPVIKVNASELPSGEYTLTAKALDYSCETDITIFHASDTVPPYTTPLWVPESTLIAPKGLANIEVSVGSSGSNYIFYMVSDTKGLIDKGYIRPQGKMQTLAVKAPVKRNERTWVNFYTVDSCRTSTQRVEIKPASALANVKVEKISFRDKINAGGQERWTFRYTFANKELAGLPVVATLTDKALNAIYPFKWNNLTEPYIGSPTSLRTQLYIYQQSLYFNHEYAKGFKTTYIYAPDIFTYDNDLYNRYGNIRIRGAHATYKQTSVTMSEAENLALDEVVVTGYGSAKKEAMTGSAAVTYDMAAADNVEEEKADEGGAPGAGPKSEQEVRYRPAEMPLAWFKPNLCTDGEGVLEISFTAPDFNTTWQLQMLGYTEEMLSDLLVEDIVASKPVMVSTNSPRFLRTGDRITLMATVYNNTDRPAPLSARMEIYDPLTEKAIVSREFAAEQVAANGSRVVALEFDAPADLEFVAYRISGSADGYSDGEQSLIAIVPSSSPVTESWPFYMAPDSNTYSLSVPRLDNQAQVFFQYCDNPVWECVTALPDMTSQADASILSLADRMYGNAIAAGLVKRYPQLGEAIRVWTQEGDSTLVSKLQRDSELKVVALGKTPWVLNAQAETLRMGNLTNLLDSDNCKKTIEEAVKRLVSEQRGGGWSWCEGMEPSMFITGQVLWRLGMLSQMGFLPEGESVKSMIASALKFCDRELYKDYVRAHKEFSTTQMLDYLYIRSFFPSVSMSADFASLKKKALAAIKDEWKGFGIYHKATAATLLAREKEPMAARTVLESVSQLASRSAERGMWFDNLRSGFFSQNTLVTTAQALEAFTEITPQAPAVDQLRQWLIIERQAQDWGRDAQLAEVVYAILSSGSDWTVSSEPARFFLGDKELTPVRRDRLTGSFTMPLSAAEASGQTLRVQKYGSHQSWGGVLARYIAPINEVKEFSESDVTVRKRILVVEQGKDGTSVRPIAKGESLKLGQRIRVQLTVTSERDIDYAVITDERGGCMAPTDQLSHYMWQDGTGFYREIRNESTNFFLPRLPKGDFILEYDCFAGQEGEFAVGIATLQSLYAPTLSAHSAGDLITITK